MAKYSDLIEKKYELPDTAEDILLADVTIMELFLYLNLFDTSSEAAHYQIKESPEQVWEKMQASKQRLEGYLKQWTEKNPALAEDFGLLAEAFYALITEAKYNSARAIVRNANNQIQYKRISLR